MVKRRRYGPGERRLDVVDPASSKIGGAMWSVVGGDGSMSVLSRGDEPPPATTSRFSTDADRRR